MTEENMFLWRMYAIQILCYLKQLCVNLIVRNLLICPNCVKHFQYATTIITYLCKKYLFYVVKIVVVF